MLHLDHLQRFHFERSWATFSLYNIDDFASHFGNKKILSVEKNYDSLVIAQRFSDIAGCEVTEPDPAFFSSKENILNRRLLWDSSKCVRAGLERMEIPVPHDIAFGTIPDYKANACKLICPAGGHFILFNSGMFTLLSSLSRVIAKSIEFVGKHQDGEGDMFRLNTDSSLVESDSDLGRIFISAIENFYNSDSSGETLVPFNHDDTRRALFLDMFCVSVAFVMAHEYAHLILNHNRKDKDGNILRLREFQSGKREVWLMSQSQVNELEADAMAWIICLHAFYPRMCIPSIYMGVEIFLIAATMIDSFFGDPSSSHPAGNDRMNDLRKIIKEQLPEANLVCSVGDDLRKIFDVLVNKNRDELPPIFKQFD